MAAIRPRLGALGTPVVLYRKEAIVARISRILLTLTVLLGVAVLGVPGTAMAAETAYNTKTQYLEVLDGGTSCRDRRIFLAAGHYDWGQLMTRAQGGTERSNLELGEGWYSWRDCLEGTSQHPPYTYSHETWLDPENPDWQAIKITGKWFLRFDGDYTWGSYLDPRF
jgi:hypothetical protein